MNKDKFQISIIIPVLNEEESIEKILVSLKKQASTAQLIKEVIIVDGGSTDQTTTIAKEQGATVITSAKGRAKQMNAGAKIATAELLYFLHVDTFPPKNYDLLILNAVTKNNAAGCFTMVFDTDHLLLNFFAWFSKFNYRICRGGDQSLFLTKSLFNTLNGFNEHYKIYEDNEIIERIYKKTDFVVLKEKVTTSARRYEEVGVYKLQYYFGIIHLKKRLGASPEKLYAYYRKKITA